MAKRFQNLLARLGLSQPSQESRARKAFILNILLVAIMCLIAVGISINVFGMLINPLDSQTSSQNSLPILVLLVLLFFFMGLHALSLRGFSLLSAHIFIAILFSLAFYMQLRWGVDVTAAILFNVLCIVMSGILINTRFALIVLGVIILSVSVMGYLQETGILIADHYWRSQEWSQTDTIMTSVIMAIIATVSALSTWQSEHALKRAIESEEALKRQRDSLEETVEQRTRELRLAEMERLTNVYRFAEFGRMSSGLFHNLGNLLTALTLNMDRLKQTSTSEVASAKEHLDRAISVNEKMRQFIESVRRQLAGHRQTMVFSATNEVREVVQVAAHRAMEHKVKLELSLDDEGIISGNPVTFSQIVTNLVSNAIDAYHDLPKSASKTRKVSVGIKTKGDDVTLSVKDWGCGIPATLQDKVFEPFFTTKSSAHGTGIGLALVKRMVEHDFQGAIRLDSQEGEYTEFTITLPRANAK